MPIQFNDLTYTYNDICLDYNGSARCQNVNVTDTISLSEESQLMTAFGIYVSDLIQISEELQLFTDLLRIIVSQAIQVSEFFPDIFRSGRSRHEWIPLLRIEEETIRLVETEQSIFEDRIINKNELIRGNDIGGFAE